MSLRNLFFKLAGCVLWATTTFSGSHSKSARFLADSPRPNVIIFVADDMGMELGCYGDAYARTPHLDALADEGILFSTAYNTHSSCSSSRSSILTGLYPHQNGQVGLSQLGYSMDRVYPSIPTLLKAGGYRTAILGKLHVAPESAFDLDLLWLDVRDNIVNRDVRKLATVAEEFITQSGDTPFFMMFNTIDPHRPFANQKMGLPENPLTADEVATLPFLGVDADHLRAESVAYYNSVTRADYALGLLVESLRKAGKYENTLIIAMGDNGPPFSRAKATCYEAGLRAPFIVRWGGGVATKGSVRKELISSIDIMPTVLAAAGVEVPDNLPGQSIIPLLAGIDVEWRHYLCGEYTSHNRQAFFPRRSVRDGRFKLIFNYLRTANPMATAFPAFRYVKTTEQVPGYVKTAYRTYQYPPEYELYDLSADPHEFYNLIDSPDHKDAVERLKQGLSQWQHETADTLVVGKQKH